MDLFSKCTLVAALVLCGLPTKSSAGNSSRNTVKYYAIFYGIEGRGIKLPVDSHTAATYVRVETSPNGREKVTHVDLSWMPGHYWKDRKLNLVKQEEGFNYSIERTLGFASRAGLSVKHYGPFAIGEKLFRDAKAQSDYLGSGRVDYRAADKRGRQLSFQREAGGYLNCIHTVSDLAGYLPTGRLHGDAATRRVVDFYKTKGKLGTESPDLYFSLRKKIEGNPDIMAEIDGPRDLRRRKSSPPARMLSVHSSGGAFE